MAAPWDGRLATFLGYGDVADRPATPNTAPGMLCIWFDTVSSSFAFYESVVAGWTDFPTPLTVETTQDLVAAMLVAGTNMVVTYNDGAGTITIDGKTDEQIEDLISTFLTAGANIQIDYDDVGNVLEISVTGSLGATVLADLTDVDVTSTPPTDQQALIWDDATSLWIPGDVAGGGGGGGQPGRIYEVMGQPARNSASDTDPYATMGDWGTASDDFNIYSIAAEGIWRNGKTYEGVVFEVDPTTGDLVSVLGVTPSFTWAFTDAASLFRTPDFATPIAITAGMTIFHGVRRTDGTGTTNMGLCYRNEPNNYFTSPMELGGTMAWALNVDPTVGDTPALRGTSRTVWTCGFVHDWKMGSAGGGGGDPTTPPTFRPGTVVHNSASSINAPIDAAAVAGDPCFLWSHGGNGPQPSDDWGIIKSIENGGWNGVLCYKILDSTDISNGYVTMPYTGSFDNCAFAWSYDAATFGGIISADIDNTYGYFYQNTNQGITVPARVPVGGHALTGTTVRSSDTPTSADGTLVGQVVFGSGSMSVWDASIDVFGVAGNNIDNTTGGTGNYTVLRFAALGK